MTLVLPFFVQHWIRKGQYPGIVPGSTLGADGAGKCFLLRNPTASHEPHPGIVVAAHDDNDELLNERVFLVPSRGWENDPLAPEAP